MVALVMTGALAGAAVGLLTYIVLDKDRRPDKRLQIKVHFYELDDPGHLDNLYDWQRWRRLEALRAGRLWDLLR